jgi:hypothetical protein
MSGRGLPGGINHITCHDGTTLNDLTSSQPNHNEADGANKRDGPDANLAMDIFRESPEGLFAVGGEPRCEEPSTYRASPRRGAVLVARLAGIN